MARLDIIPFADEHLHSAGRLLAERHRRQRQAEPLLPRLYEDPAHARAEVEAAWHTEGASGAVGLLDGRFAGYLIGAPRPTATWGPNVWVEGAGHAVEEQELVRDLYAAAAVRWVEDARTCHYVLVPATDPALVDAWFRLGFGQQHVHALREVPPVAVDRARAIKTRRARNEDIDAVVTLDLVLPEYQFGSPVFARGHMPAPADIRADWVEELADPKLGVFIAELNGRAVGTAVGAPVEASNAHAGVLRPHAACLLGFAVTIPDVRGLGAGRALTEAIFAWAREHGYETIVVDWRATNLLASRFWPRRGFRPTFLRLYRSIP